MQRGGDQTPLFGELGHKCPCARSQNFICVLPLNILPAPATRGRIQGSSCRWDGPRSPGCPLGVPWGQGRGCASALTLGRGQTGRWLQSQGLFSGKSRGFYLPWLWRCPWGWRGGQGQGSAPSRGDNPSPAPCSCRSERSQRQGNTVTPPV